MEHRYRKRRPAFGLVKILHNGNQEAAGLIHNGTADGIFVVTTADININTPVEILVDILGHEKRTKIPCFIIHRNKNGFGMTFRNLDAAARVFVNNICNQFQERKNAKNQPQGKDYDWQRGDYTNDATG